MRNTQLTRSLRILLPANFSPTLAFVFARARAHTCVSSAQSLRDIFRARRRKIFRSRAILEITSSRRAVKFRRANYAIRRPRVSGPIGTLPSRVMHHAQPRNGRTSSLRGLLARIPRCRAELPRGSVFPRISIPVSPRRFWLSGARPSRLPAAIR